MTLISKETTFHYLLREHDELILKGLGKYDIFIVDDNYNPADFPTIRSQPGVYRVTVDKPVMVQVKCDQDFIYDVIELPRRRENLDPTPIEVPADMYHETLEEKMARFMVRAMEERFGPQDEMETFEESMDFDVDDDDEDALLSGYEIQEMQEEYEPANPKDDSSKRSETQDAGSTESKETQSPEP